MRFQWGRNTLTNQVENFGGTAHQAKELAEANSIFTTEITSLQESMAKAKANVVEEFKDSQPFFDLLGSQYSEGFEDIRKQAVLLFFGVDFSSVQIDTTILMTSRGDDEVVDIEDGEDKGVSGGETLTPRVTQGDGSTQSESLTEDRTDLVPTA